MGSSGTVTISTVSEAYPGTEVPLNIIVRNMTSVSQLFYVQCWAPTNQDKDKWLDTSVSLEPYNEKTFHEDFIMPEIEAFIYARLEKSSATGWQYEDSKYKTVAVASEPPPPPPEEIEIISVTLRVV